MDFHVTAGYITSNKLPFLLDSLAEKFSVESNCKKVVLVGNFYRIIRYDKFDDMYANTKRVCIDVAISFDNYINMMKLYNKLCVIIEHDCIYYKKDITHSDICDGDCLENDNEFKFIGPLWPNLVSNYKANFEIFSRCDGKQSNTNYYVCEEVNSITIFENGKYTNPGKYIATCNDYSYKVIEVMAIDESTEEFDVSYRFDNGVISIYKNTQ